MKFIPHVILACTLFILTGASKSPVKTEHLFISNSENVLGTSLEVKIQAVSEKDAAIAEAAALNEIDRLEKILSAYNPKSEFSNWFISSNIAEKISPELFEVLSLFDKGRTRKEGALDA